MGTIGTTALEVLRWLASLAVFYIIAYQGLKYSLEFFNEVARRRENMGEWPPRVTDKSWRPTRVVNRLLALEIMLGAPAIWSLWQKNGIWLFVILVALAAAAHLGLRAYERHRR